MIDTNRKRAARARYEAAVASWRTSYTCPACRNTGTIQHEDGSLPCPMCDPAGAREAAEGAKP